MFIPVAAEIIGELVLKKKVLLHTKVIELGNQTYSVPGNVIRTLAGKLKEVPDIVREYSVDLAALRALAEMPAAHRPKQSDAPHVKEFFKALGFSSYTAVDINSDLGSIVMDLNADLALTYNYRQTYGLVTNIGVSEHLFNQATFFKNAHDLTSEGGLMLHIVPFLGYINHGFWNYEPRIFYDLTAANGYELISLSMTERNLVVLDLTRQTETLTYFHEYIHSLTENGQGNLLVAAVLRKTNSEPFVVPLQGKYISDIGDATLEKYRTRSNLSSYPPPKGFFAIPSGKRPLRLRFKKKLLVILERTVAFITIRL